MMQHCDCEGMCKCCVAFGALIFLVGLFYTLQDLNFFATRIGMWRVLVMIVGLGMMGMMMCKSKK